MPVGPHNTSTLSERTYAMTVIVAGKLIENSGSLSELARQTLTYIDGGTQWLAWAMRNPMASYQLADETSLLAEVQLGLHGSPMTLLPRTGLSVSPVKLMTLGGADLRTLGLMETGDTSAAVAQQTQRILHDNHLLTAQQLGAAGDFLRELQVRAAPVFQALDFNDRVALCELAVPPPGHDSATPGSLRQEAAAYAVEQARTVPEFCDYYQVYLAHATKLGALDSTAAARGQLVDQAVQTLLPLAFGALDCPQLPDRLPAPAEVERSLHNLLARGYKIGFSRLSQAVLQMVTQTVFTRESGADAARLFDLYLGAAAAFLAGNRLMQARLEQDGSALTFTLRSENQQARLHVNAQRLLSLRMFGTIPPDADAAPSMPPATTEPE